MIRRETYEQIQGFDEDFELYFEDSDLCWRALRAGWQIDFVEEAKIIHRLGQSTQGSWSITSLIYQQSHLAYYRKHAPLWAVYLLKSYLLLKWLRLLIVSRLTREHPARARAYCRWYLRVTSENSKIALSDRLPT